MKIDITDLQDIVKLDKDKIRSSAARALEILGEKGSELSLLFVDDSYIRRLNRKYLGIDSATDVLAFSMREGEGLPKDGPILGDVVVSAETAKRESKKRKIPFKNELGLYIAHGILHLLGYKDSLPADRKKMRRKESEILEVM